MEIYGYKIKFNSFILETSLIPKRRAPLCALTSWTLPFRIPLIKQQFSDVARWFYFLRIAAEFVCVTNERYVRLLVRKCARFCFVCHDTSFKKNDLLTFCLLSFTRQLENLQSKISFAEETKPRCYHFTSSVEFCVRFAPTLPPTLTKCLGR